MTGYQKLKRENKILWATIKIMIEANHENESNQQELVEKELAWIRWKVEHETNQEKN